MDVDTFAELRGAAKVWGCDGLLRLVSIYPTDAGATAGALTKPCAKRSWLFSSGSGEEYFAKQRKKGFVELFFSRC